MAQHVELLDGGHPFRQWRTWRLPGSGLTLTGYSRSNDKTFFHVPELRCALDAGLCETRPVDTVFLTHTHLDHAKELDHLTEHAGAVYLPADAEPYARAFLRASVELNSATPYDPALGREPGVHGVRGGDGFTFGKRGAHAVRVVDCQHKVPCVGYAFAEVRRALKPEYEELKAALGADFGRVIGQHRKDGVDVDREVHRPLFAYLGDTDVTVFAGNPWLFEYPVIITECTYLDDDQLDRAGRIGHTVWSQLRPIVEAHPETIFVLIHFSLRYSDRDVVEFFDREAGRGVLLDNVVVWASPHSHLPQPYLRG
jgi:ribonuclease Z